MFVLYKGLQVEHLAISVGHFSAVVFQILHLLQIAVALSSLQGASVVSELDLSRVSQTSLPLHAGRGIKSSGLPFVRCEYDRECSRQAACSSLPASLCGFYTCERCR